MGGLGEGGVGSGASEIKIKNKINNLRGGGEREGDVCWEWGLPFCNVFPLLVVNRYALFHFNA